MAVARDELGYPHHPCSSALDLFCHVLTHCHGIEIRDDTVSDLVPYLESLVHRPKGIYRIIDRSGLPRLQRFKPKL
jgi:hypothetical protein